MGCEGREWVASEQAERLGVAMSSDCDVGCEEALKRLLELIDGELSVREQEDVQRHLSTCRSCFSRMEFEQRLKQRLSTLPADDVPATLRQRVHDLIKGF
jgi:anti-sigma factor (TIGR02949 family)